MIRRFIFAIFLLGAGVFQSPAYAGSCNDGVPAAPPLPPDIMSALMNWAPMLLLIGVWIFMMRRSAAARALSPQSDPTQMSRETLETFKEGVSVLKQMLEELKRR